MSLLNSIALLSVHLSPVLINSTVHLLIPSAKELNSNGKIITQLCLEMPLQIFFFPTLNVALKLPWKSFFPLTLLHSCSDSFKVSSPLPKTPPHTHCLLSATELTSCLSEKIKTEMNGFTV